MDRGREHLPIPPKGYFGLLHKRLTHLYGCRCDQCQHQGEQLELANDPKFKSLLNTVEKAFKKLHKLGKYKIADLKKVKEYRQLITGTNSLLSRALNDNDLSEELLESLENDIFYFSQLKTHAQLFEASQLLLTEEKTIKSFQQFSKDIASIKTNYNESYLEAEYDFAVGSVLMADRWDKFKEGDRYLLQYRTAKDDKVRDSHRKLDETTLPKDHPFWDRFFPPNGWRCRCTVLQVLARLHKQTDGDTALKNGEAATNQVGKNGKNKLEIFRFNPGKAKVVFPPTHPYSKVAGAKNISK